MSTTDGTMPPSDRKHPRSESPGADYNNAHVLKKSVKDDNEVRSLMIQAEADSQQNPPLTRLLNAGEKGRKVRAALFAVKSSRGVHSFIKDEKKRRATTRRLVNLRTEFIYQQLDSGQKEDVLDKIYKENKQPLDETSEESEQLPNETDEENEDEEKILDATGKDDKVIEENEEILDESSKDGPKKTCEHDLNKVGGEELYEKSSSQDIREPQDTEVHIDKKSSSEDEHDLGTSPKHRKGLEDSGYFSIIPETDNGNDEGDVATEADSEGHNFLHPEQTLSQKEHEITTPKAEINVTEDHVAEEPSTLISELVSDEHGPVHAEQEFSKNTYEISNKATTTIEEGTTAFKGLYVTMSAKNGAVSPVEGLFSALSKEQAATEIESQKVTTPDLSESASNRKGSHSELSSRNESVVALRQLWDDLPEAIEGSTLSDPGGLQTLIDGGLLIAKDWLIHLDHLYQSEAAVIGWSSEPLVWLEEGLKTLDTSDEVKEASCAVSCMIKILDLYPMPGNPEGKPNFTAVYPGTESKLPSVAASIALFVRYDVERNVHLRILEWLWDAIMSELQGLHFKSDPEKFLRTLLENILHPAQKVFARLSGLRSSEKAQIGWDISSLVWFQNKLSKECGPMDGIASSVLEVLVDIIDVLKAEPLLEVVDASILSPNGTDTVNPECTEDERVERIEKSWKAAELWLNKLLSLRPSSSTTLDPDETYFDPVLRSLQKAMEELDSSIGPWYESIQKMDSSVHPQILALRQLIQILHDARNFDAEKEKAKEMLKLRQPRSERKRLLDLGLKPGLLNDALLAVQSAPGRACYHELQALLERICQSLEYQEAPDEYKSWRGSPEDHTRRREYEMEPNPEYVAEAINPFFQLLTDRTLLERMEMICNTVDWPEIYLETHHHSILWYASRRELLQAAEECTNKQSLASDNGNGKLSIRYSILGTLIARYLNAIKKKRGIRLAPIDCANLEQGERDEDSDECDEYDLHVIDKTVRGKAFMSCQKNNAPEPKKCNKVNTPNGCPDLFCSFSHAVKGLVCRDGKGCTRRNCAFAHGPIVRKEDVETSALTTARGHYGQADRQNSDTESDANTPDTRSKKKLCKFVNRAGGCKSSDKDCPYSHEKRGVACKSLQAGKSCMHGDRCFFAHDTKFVTGEAQSSTTAIGGHPSSGHPLKQPWNQTSTTSEQHNSEGSEFAIPAREIPQGSKAGRQNVAPNEWQQNNNGVNPSQSFSSYLSQPFGLFPPPSFFYSSQQPDFYPQRPQVSVGYATQAQQYQIPGAPGPYGFGGPGGGYGAPNTGHHNHISTAMGTRSNQHTNRFGQASFARPSNNRRLGQHQYYARAEQASASCGGFVNIRNIVNQTPQAPDLHHNQQSNGAGSISRGGRVDQARHDIPRGGQAFGSKESHQNTSTSNHNQRKRRRNEHEQQYGLGPNSYGQERSPKRPRTNNNRH